jgi:hypothetical protein
MQHRLQDNATLQVSDVSHNHQLHILRSLQHVVPAEAIGACCAKAMTCASFAIANCGYASGPAADGALQELALKTLLTGAGVMPKTFSNGWQVPTDTPINYAGPFVLANVSARYGGKNKNSEDCPQNYPDGAPRDDCAHISLVEVGVFTGKAAVRV